MKYQKASPRSYWRRDEEMRKIGDMAERILEGEESLLEEYEELVQEFVKITRGQAPAFETDPVMYKELCDKWGRAPSMMISSGNSKRHLNYTEMTRFLRGYWR